MYNHIPINFKLCITNQTIFLEFKWFVQPSGEGVVFRNFESGQYAYTTSVKNGSSLLGSSHFTTWHLYQDGNEWTISFPGTNYVVELQGGNAANGTAIQLCTQHGAGAKYQKWIFEKIDERQAQQLHPELEHQPLLQQHHAAHRAAQQMYQQPILSPVSPGIYFLRNVMSGTLFTLHGGSADEGVEITGYISSGRDHQKWHVQPVGYSQKITLRNAQSHTYVWSQCQSFVPSVLAKSSCHSQDYIITTANRGFYISPAQQPNHALSLLHGSTENGTKVGIWYNEEQDNQK
ncbi:hypothetical protein B0J17DRAFT_719515 [Rhizoctonia solani]|nr:hypothetical protein B0J17DRAFT_719515 [Rhizoctonia solani]